MKKHNILYIISLQGTNTCVTMTLLEKIEITIKWESNFFFKASENKYNRSGFDKVFEVERYENYKKKRHGS